MIGLDVQRNPERGRIAVDAIAEEAGRCDSDNREGLVLDVERRADDAGIGGVVDLPGLIAEYRDRGCAGLVVGGKERAAGIGSEAERREIVSGDVFGGFCLCRSWSGADVDAVVAGLEGGELFELGRGVLEVAVEIVGEDVEIAIVVDVAAVHAAVVEVANAVQGRGIGDRERLQQNRVDQGEDGDVGSDAEGDGEDHGGGEAGGLPELAEGKFEIVHIGYGREDSGRVSSVSGAREIPFGFAQGRLSLRLIGGSVRNDAGDYATEMKKPLACARGFFRGRDLSLRRPSQTYFGCCA